jgi:hypothetical protein
MAADLTFSVDDSALEHTTLALLRESYCRLLTGTVCRVHGRGVRITTPDGTNELNLSGCCEAFMLEARSALRQPV